MLPLMPGPSTAHGGSLFVFGMQNAELPPPAAGTHSNVPLGRFTCPTPPSLTGLLIVAGALDFLGQALFLAHFLEAAEHLLERLIASGLHLDHAADDPFCNQNPQRGC